MNCLTMEDVLNEIMLCEKNISNSYSVAINEMSNDKLYKKVLDIFIDTKNIAREIYNYMYENGLYQITTEKDNKIEQSFIKYNEKYNELN